MGNFHHTIPNLSQCITHVGWDGCSNVQRYTVHGANDNNNDDDDDESSGGSKGGCGHEAEVGLKKSPPRVRRTDTAAAADAALQPLHCHLHCMSTMQPVLQKSLHTLHCIVHCGIPGYSSVRLCATFLHVALQLCSLSRTSYCCKYKFSQTLCQSILSL